MGEDPKGKWIFVSPNSSSDHPEDHPTPVDISWYNLNVYAKRTRYNEIMDKLREREIVLQQIIKDVSGEAKHGNMLAIIGASGSGKTTLLNVLTGRNLYNLDVQGTVLLNGRVSTIEGISSCSAYVQQDDLFLNNLTVREHLLYQAMLRMKPGTSNENITKRVNDVLLELSLNKIADSMIGGRDSKKNISGGEMKRLAFASEILTNPSILFCDEPTSGLDSYMAYSVTSLLKSMANLQRTIIITIHQPSSDIYSMFDSLLLIVEGRVAFSGSPEDCLKFYSSLNLQVPPQYNPADFFVQKLAIVPGNEVESRQKVLTICDRFNDSVYGKSLRKKLTELYSTSMEDYQPTSESIFYRSNYLEQFKVVLRRAFLCNWREYSVTSVRFAETFFISLIMGLIYFRQEYNQESIMNITGGIFMILINNTLTPAISVINTFCHEIRIFIREHNNGLYRVNVYFLAKTIAELPFFTILPFISLTISYWMINLNSKADRYAVALLCILLVSNVSASFGYLIGCLCQSITVALSLAPTLLSSLLIFAGLPINQRSIPKYIAWAKYLSWPYYGNEIMIVNQWKGVRNISCPYWSNNRYITSTPYGAQIIDCTVTGEGVISKLAFDVNHVTFNFLMLTLLIIVFRLSALSALYYRAKSFR